MFFRVVLYIPHEIHFTLSIFKTTDINVENMAENILTFTNTEFGSIRVMEINGQPWFVGKDVADTLGYGNHRQALKTNVDEDDKGVHWMDTPGGKQKTVIINESGLYSLIMSSKLPTAKQFKRWVTSEVLPSVRKNGGYIAIGILIYIKTLIVWMLLLCGKSILFYNSPLIRATT